MIIPQRFRDQIWLHLKRLELSRSTYKHLLTPRILCIEGSPGVGKSTQLRRCLEEIGSQYVGVDASSFGSEYENSPAENLQTIIKGLSDGHREGLPRPSLIIDDFDLSLGRLASSTTYTVNNQLTTGWLMSIADEAYGSYFDDSSPAIFVTGNDLSSIYAPLLRAGRAARFHYDPTPEELVDILQPMIADSFAIEEKLLSAPASRSLAEILLALTGIVDEKVLARRDDTQSAFDLSINMADLSALGFTFHATVAQMGNVRQ